MIAKLARIAGQIFAFYDVQHGERRRTGEGGSAKG